MAIRARKPATVVQITEAVTVEIAKLELKAGDVLFVKVPEPTSPEICRSLMERLHDYLRGAGHDNVLVMTGPFDLQKLTLPDDAVDQLAEQLADKVAAILEQRPLRRPLGWARRPPASEDTLPSAH